MRAPVLCTSEESRQLIGHGLCSFACAARCERQSLSDSGIAPIALVLPEPLPLAVGKPVTGLLQEFLCKVCALGDGVAATLHNAVLVI